MYRFYRFHHCNNYFSVLHQNALQKVCHSTLECQKRLQNVNLFEPSWLLKIKIASAKFDDVRLCLNSWCNTLIECNLRKILWRQVSYILFYFQKFPLLFNLINAFVRTVILFTVFILNNFVVVNFCYVILFASFSFTFVSLYIIHFMTGSFLMKLLIIFKKITFILLQLTHF